MLRLVGILLLLAMVESVSAQIVNIERRRTGEDKEGLLGTVNFDFSITKNNRLITNFGPNAQLSYVKGKNKFLLLGSYTLSEAGDETLVNRGFGHFRYTRTLNDWLAWEAFTQVQYDEILRLGQRVLAGTGPRFEISNTDTFRLNIGTLYMYEYEEPNSDEAINRQHRMSSYISFGYSPKAYISFDHITYYQPRLNAFSDFRVSSITSVNIKITEVLSFGIVYDLYHDEFPPEGAPSTVYSVSNRLRFDF